MSSQSVPLSKFWNIPQMLPSTSSLSVIQNHRCYITYAVHKLSSNRQKLFLKLHHILPLRNAFNFSAPSSELPWKTAQDGSKSILSTAGLQLPAKRKNDCEHVTGSDVAVISRKHSDINFWVRRKSQKKKKLSARACLILTFRGPCIVIHSYNESQRDAQFVIFIWQSTLHISDMSTVYHQEYLNTVYTQ
jgi:hypothetical protein